MEDPTKPIRRRVTIDCGAESRTKQSFRDQVNVNEIVKRALTSGQLDHVNHREPLFGDFSKSTDLKSQIDAVHQAEESFKTLSSGVRKAAQNKPHILLEMLASDTGCQELRDAGLVVNTEPPAPPAPAPVIPPSKPPEGANGAES